MNLTDKVRLITTDSAISKRCQELITSNPYSTRSQVIKSLIDLNKPVEEVMDAYNVKRDTINKWLNELIKGGVTTKSNHGSQRRSNPKRNSSSNTYDEIIKSLLIYEEAKTVAFFNKTLKTIYATDPEKWYSMMKRLQKRTDEQSLIYRLAMLIISTHVESAGLEGCTDPFVKDLVNISKEYKLDIHGKYV